MTIVFFDLETTGLDPVAHTVIQIAACAVDRVTFDVIEYFEVKVKFNVSKANPDALTINSYNEDVWKAEAVMPGVARDKFLSFLSRYKSVPKLSKAGNIYNVAQLAGYNSERFDIPFFWEWSKKIDKHEFSRSGEMKHYNEMLREYSLVKLNHTQSNGSTPHPGEPPTKPEMGYGKFLPINFWSIDLLQLALFNQIMRGVDYKDLKLITVCEKHGVANVQQHDAMDDIRLTAALFPLLVQGIALDNGISQEATGNAAEQMTMSILDSLPQVDTSYAQ